MSNKIVAPDPGAEREYELLRNLAVSALRAGLPGLPTKPTHYVAIVGGERIPCSAAVRERYLKFYGETWPIQFEPIDPGAP